MSEIPRYRHTYDTTFLAVEPKEDMRVLSNWGWMVRVYNIELTDWPDGLRTVRVEGRHIRKDGEPGAGTAAAVHGKRRSRCRRSWPRSSRTRALVGGWAVSPVTDADLAAHMAHFVLVGCVSDGPLDDIPFAHEAEWSEWTQARLDVPR